MSFSTAANLAYGGVTIAGRRLYDFVRNPEDALLTPFVSANPAVRYLRRYLDFLLHDVDLFEGTQLDEHIETTLLDLIALAFEGRPDAVDLARGRGLRAARLREALAKIHSNFADPDFSVERVASKIGLSPNYIQKLLHETGSSFSERVLELRLQKARAMLIKPANDRLKVSDIALACGFNDVSYFNRCFRRRFGCSPTQYRGGGAQT